MWGGGCKKAKKELKRMVERRKQITRKKSDLITERDKTRKEYKVNGRNEVFLCLVLALFVLSFIL